MCISYFISSCFNEGADYFSPFTNVLGNILHHALRVCVRVCLLQQQHVS